MPRGGVCQGGCPDQGPLGGGVCQGPGLGGCDRGCPGPGWGGACVCTPACTEADTPPLLPSRRLLLRTVRILLEFILVFIKLFDSKLIFYGKLSCVLYIFLTTMPTTCRKSRVYSLRIFICIIIAGLGQIQTSTRIPKPMAALYYAKHVHITQTTQIPTPLFCIVQGSKSDSESVRVSESDNVIKQLY